MSDLTLYVTSWCPYCASLTESLAERGVVWREVDVDRDRQAAEKVKKINGGNRVVPTVEFPDGTTMTNPTGAQVVSKLNQLKV
ncbi:mycoredoxin [Enemella sp. A6]|uniref:mycoredoxin n=1 Tax=Enemella sp. A6 TaxID=3440152 RepID=UPI003EBB9053